MSKTIYLPHGGGPLPLLEPEAHASMIRFFKDFSKDYTPEAIVVFSAHYEADIIQVMYDNGDDLVYDYYGFPKESYQLTYQPPKDLVLGKRIVDALNRQGIKAESSRRGFDHGVYVPLLLMYPKANIPVIQVSLKRGLDEAFHIAMGKALSVFADQDILFIGSGFSFHNLRAFFTGGEDPRNEAFQTWLKEVVSSDKLLEGDREASLIHWRDAPYADYVHPRSEHLIPLFVCYGIHQTRGAVPFDDRVAGKRSIAVTWE